MEDKTHTVYLHINPKNKKVYAGITNQKDKKVKISIANRGSNNGMFGKPMPLNTKTAIIIAVSKPVLQLDSNDNIINRFSSASEAERHLNGKGSHISCCCLGKRKTAYGYRWKYE